MTDTTTLKAFVTSDTITGYKLAKVVNEMLVKYELTTIPPQMVYAYMRSGAIKTVIVGEQKVVSRDAANEWLNKYLDRRINKTVTPEEN